ncbi:nuclear transport factor 2 family protein [Sphingomonas sp. SRS2]|uniref:nuclear transport factor 2 family protein n=1 Tax=Sphingomonas sp. SRS2 TaxID=133190 RepID=UPI0006184960|nr:nuclear transport factor 2 family protein [Sphingomonas sp. SRS2]KKC24034.1 hypothetical protein WP12_21590 [Sphingomonas sp. SRS2]
MPLTTADELEIIRLINRYSHAASNQDADALIDLFTDDVVWERKVGANDGKYTDRVRIEGRNAYRDFALQMFEVQGAIQYQYVATNPVVIGDGDRAEGVSTTFIIGVSDNNPSLMLLGNFDDEFRKTADGWKFSYRGMRCTM